MLCGSEILLVGIYPKEMKCPQKEVHMNVHSNFILNKLHKLGKSPNIHQQKDRLWYNSCKTMLFTKKKERIIDICNKQQEQISKTF